MGRIETILKLVEMFRQWATTADQVLEAIDWLKHYGYLTKEGTITVEDVVEALTKLQKITGALKVDGELGPNTLNAMKSWPRCGVSDRGMLEARASVRAWGVKDLTYFIQKRDSDLPQGEWDSIIKEAFDSWQDICSLRFSKVDSTSGANLVISTGRGARDDFDGPGNTLAYAFLPPQQNFKGQLLMRFDEDETWTKVGANRGIYLRNVACHEIGHLLGLEHSNESSALMAPFYSPNIVKPQNNDDVTRIRAIYGNATGPGPVDPPPPPGDPKVLTAPTNLTVTHEDGKAILRWKDNSSGENGFEVWRNGVKFGQVKRGIKVASDSNVADGTYSYKVRAFGDNIFSGFSNEFVITIGSEPPPPPPPEPRTKTVTFTVTGDNLVFDVKEG
jgi:hypothetical protein